MRIRLLMILLLSALAARAIERDVVRAFPVSPGAQLKIAFYRGAITVDEADVKAISVTAHLEMRTESEEKADQLEAALNLEMAADGNAVAIRADDPAGRGLRISVNDDPLIDVDCHVVVPRRCSVDLTTHDGSITVGSLAGRIAVQTTKGNIFLKRIDGSIEAHAEKGDVIISRCSGEVTASTLQGVIRVGTIGGRAELKSASGDIEVLAARGGLDARAEAGDVTVGFPANLAGGARVRTGYGNILAKIDPAADCIVEASSFWGHVQSALPLQVESGADGAKQLTGRLNRGGPRLVLSANGGHVKIVPGETLFN